VAATIAWIVVVHWRISRRPSVLWRAVVLSSGGVILCWVLLMTLWLPWVNYGKSYAGVAEQIEAKLTSVKQCVQTNVGPAQRPPSLISATCVLPMSATRVAITCCCRMTSATRTPRSCCANIPATGAWSGKAAAPPTVTSASASIAVPAADQGLLLA
jgi:hypothetical protein